MKIFIKVLLVLIGLAIAGFIGYKAIKYKLDPAKQLTMSTSVITADVRNKQLECLAKNIYFEAGGESFEGKVAVAQVTINRAESGKFPKDICQVVYQKNVVYEKVLCQFSWYCQQASGVKPKNIAVFRESELVARQVLLENFRLPSLKNALYFHATHINPKWDREKVAQIGGHVFYK
jgi:spore germination cell wall hydrolase CwlJ-like protein